MKNNLFSTLVLVLICSHQYSVQAMGLRSFVALPVDKGGSVVRFQLESSQDQDTDHVILNGAYGLSADQTLLLGLAYRLSPSGSERLGDLGVLYRYTIMQNDFREGTHRLGLLGGIVVPMDSDRDAAIQAGLVSTHFRGRNEWDIDVLYRAGIGNRLDSGRYDISWQFRLTPEHYPDWGIDQELNSVLELGGRWNEGSETIHQVTIGLQWIHRTWVLEGGVFQDINGPKDTHFLLSTRVHF